MTEKEWKIPPAKYGELKFDWDYGVSATEMARKYGCSRQLIMSMSRRLKFKPRPADFVYRSLPKPGKIVLTPWPDKVRFEDDPEADKVGAKVFIKAPRAYGLLRV